jgi:hypothetical protein
VNVILLSLGVPLTDVIKPRSTHHCQQHTDTYAIGQDLKRLQQWLTFIPKKTYRKRENAYKTYSCLCTYQLCKSYKSVQSKEQLMLHSTLYSTRYTLQHTVHFTAHGTLYSTRYTLQHTVHFTAHGTATRFHLTFPCRVLLCDMFCWVPI